MPSRPCRTGVGGLQCDRHRSRIALVPGQNRAVIRSRAARWAAPTPTRHGPLCAKSRHHRIAFVVDVMTPTDFRGRFIRSRTIWSVACRTSHVPEPASQQTTFVERLRSYRRHAASRSASLSPSILSKSSLLKMQVTDPSFPIHGRLLLRYLRRHERCNAPTTTRRIRRSRSRD